MKSLPLSVSMVLLSHLIGPPLGMHPDLAFDAATVAATTLFIPSVNYLHPYLHMPRKEAMAKADPFMRWFLNTRFILWVSRMHFVHHRDGAANINLLSAGMDHLFGTAKAPTVTDLLRLRDLNAIY